MVISLFVTGVRVQSIFISSRLRLVRYHSTTAAAAMASPLTITTKYRMNSGYEIPVLGYGVFKTPADVCKEVTLKAFEVGYRHVDSAIMYANEGPCGEAIKQSGIPRSELFFTTKIPSQHLGYEKSKAAIDNSLKEAKQEYFDLILIHDPYADKEARLGTWRALLEAKKAGKTRSIGVSNWGVHHLEQLEEYMKQNGGDGSAIDVGQYELHPWLTRPDIVNWLRKRNVVVEAYCPLVRGRRMDEPVLKKLAGKYKKTPAQILVRWSLQKGFVPLPKSATPSRIEENAAVFDFELTKEDVDALTTDEYSPVSWDPTKEKN